MMTTTEAESNFFRRASRWKFIIVVLFFSLLLTIIISLNVGYAQISFTDILSILGEQLPILDNIIDSSIISQQNTSIILLIRLPRIIAGALVGAALAASGVIYQGVFKNPMADSYLLGVSAGAAVGASISIVFATETVFFGFRFVQVAAFSGALIAMFLVYNISRVGSRVPITTLLLSGIAVNFFLYAIVALVEVIAGDELTSIVFWLIGGFSNVLWFDIFSIMPFILIGITLSYFYSRDLNLLALGEENAQHLGVNVERVKKILLILASLVTAAAVSLCGLIGFVGLMVPHITRLVIGPDHRILLPASAIVGAIFLIICDSVARVIATPFASTLELPVGIITMLIGAPFFILLFKKKKERYAL